MTLSSSRFLSDRDIPELIKKYVKGNKALDYGIGEGYSAQFLINLGFDVTGVDISQNMLDQASLACPQIQMHLIKNGALPFPAKTFDFVFSSFVLLVIDSEQEILKYLKEAQRVLKKDGLFIAVTSSQYIYFKDWLIYKNDYPHNRDLKEGMKGTIFLRDAELEFTDYFRTEDTFRKLFKKAGLALLEVHYPLGKKDEKYKWQEEKICSPFVIFIASS